MTTHIVVAVITVLAVLGSAALGWILSSDGRNQ